MNEKITLPALVQLLSIATGDSRKLSEDFLREFFSAISAALAEGEQVKIKGLGVFKTVTVEERKSVNVSTGGEQIIPAHRKVVFTPSKELAALVNEPFEMFETVELSDEVSFEDDPLVETEEAEAEVEEVEDAPEAADVPDVPDVSEASDVSDLIIYDTSDTSDESSTSDESDYPATSDESETFDTPDSAELPPVIVKKRFWPGFAVGFLAGLIAAAIACVICYRCNLIDFGDQTSATSEILVEEIIVDGPQDIQASLAEDSPNAINESQEEKTESAEEKTLPEAAAQRPLSATLSQDAVPTKPSDEKIYDTISKTRYLTTMAKQYYGNYHLWPYIYMENQAFLGHPDRIKPGTKVVIPPLSKYGVDPKNPADIEKAKKKGVEIYSRYK